MAAGSPAWGQSDAAADAPSRFFAQRVQQIGEHLDGLARAAPALPSYFAELASAFRVAAGDIGPGRILLGFVLCLVAGAVIEWLFRRSTAGLKARWHAVAVRRISDRLSIIGVDAVLAVVGVLAFALGALVALLTVKWPMPINESGITFLVAIVWLRLAFTILTVLLRPGGGREWAAFDLEPLAARFWRDHLFAFVAWLALGWAVIVTLRLFGMPQEGQRLFAYLLGLGLVAVALKTIWYRSTAAGRGNAARWLASAATIAFWLVWAVRAMPLFWFLTVAIGLPLAIGAARRAARHLLRPVASDEAEPDVPSVTAVFVEQGLRAALIVGAIWLLIWGWGLDVGSLAAQENTFTRVLRGGLHALVIVLVADLAWSLIKALADNTLARAQVTADLDAEEARRRARIRTLLPIGRNVALIVLVVMAGLMALGALGVEIGPLIASAGVVGVAVGFGAQTVVRDIISGMFYMLDDAFRIGEYIQSGNYKGTVESFSLRSIKLRHQRGPLYTIPFGSLGAVQNMSRDWVIVKDVIGITYDSDIDKAKKLIKQIGLDLAKDPDLAPNILQPLKMQGVEEFGDFAIKIRTKMMTKPGEQFVIRRRANALIKKAFDANGIRFAFPTVQVAGSAGADEAAASAAAQQVLKPAANAPG